MANPVEEITLAVEALKDGDTANQAIQELQGQVETLIKVSKIVEAAGVNLNPLRRSVKQLQETLGDITDNPKSAANGASGVDVDGAAVIAWLKSNAKGADNAKNKSAIQKGIFGEGSKEKFASKSWSAFTKENLDSGSIKTNDAAGASKGYFVS